MPWKASGHKEEAEVLREIRKEAMDRGDYDEVDQIDQEIEDLFK